MDRFLVRCDLFVRMLNQVTESPSGKRLASQLCRSLELVPRLATNSTKLSLFFSYHRVGFLSIKRRKTLTVPLPYPSFRCRTVLLRE
jgi:hypothetical protein